MSFWVYSHNVYGNREKLEKILPKGPRITKGKDPVITCLQEVHADDLAKLVTKHSKNLDKNIETLNSREDRKKPFAGFKEKDDHYIVWAPDFHQGKKKNHRKGLLYLVTLIPKNFFELVMKDRGNDSKPQVKVYDSKFERHFLSKAVEDLIRQTQNWGTRICSALAIKLKTADKVFDIFNFHLPAVTSGNCRKAVLDNVLNQHKDSHRRTIIAGDFNPLFRGEENALADSLVKYGLNNPFQQLEGTYGKKKLDFIAASNSDIELTDAKVLDKFGSDHNRIRAKVTIQK